MGVVKVISGKPNFYLLRAMTRVILHKEITKIKIGDAEVEIHNNGLNEIINQEGQLIWDDKGCRGKGVIWGR